jgi:glutamate--cysteine ligase
MTADRGVAFFVVGRDTGTVTAGELTGTPADEEPPDAGPTVLHDCADAEAYVASVCFKHGPPRLIGVELEWLLHRPHAPRAPTDAAALRAALGPHAPTTLDPASPALPLPAGSEVTVEPGGQIELASQPFASLAELTGAATVDAGLLHGLVAAAGFAALDRAADPVRPPVRILDLPRYRAMEQSFDRHGPYGRSGMCSTAAVQVALDAGERDQIGARWATTHALGPVLLAAFANSPRLHGRPTGWKSARWASWLRSDPARTAPPAAADLETADPAASWASRVLRSPVLCVRRASGDWLVPDGVSFADWIDGGLPGRPPTVDDLDYHVSTLFPPVRPRGHLEVRYVDAQPGRRWALPVAVLAALLSDPGVADRARAACEPAAGRWVSAARHGLADRVLARAAGEVFELAAGALVGLDPPDWVVADLDDMIERQVLCGRCPADEPEPS